MAVDRYLTIEEGTSSDHRKRVESVQTELAQRAEVRMDNCCMCNRPANKWVREVRFTFPDNKHMAVGSEIYGGPVPGFCWLCDANGGPGQLAQAVYMDRVEVGFAQPKDWYVIYTDSTQIGGPILSLVPNNLKVEATDSYKPGGTEQ